MKEYTADAPPKTRTALVFVVHNFDETECTRATLATDLKSLVDDIWAGLDKPEGCDAVTDCIDIRCVLTWGQYQVVHLLAPL